MDPDTRLYSVPEGHKHELMTNTGIAPLAKVVGIRSDKVKECFAKDGPWGLYNAFQDISGICLLKFVVNGA